LATSFKSRNVMKQPQIKPWLERLEDRCTPATWGNPWPNPGHLTLSFVPDGTQVGDKTSSLFQKLNALAPTKTWEMEILRAFQNWAVQANINISVVADQGLPLGSPGAMQGDARFGDIRIAAVPLASTAEAISSPFELDAGTWSGDVLLNSSTSFSLGGNNDLFSVAIHEAGHVFGLDDNTNPASVMDESYLGVRTGLGAADVAALQAIYGTRFPDLANNNQLSTATPLNLLANPDGSLGMTVNADLANLHDKDFYSFNTLLNLGGVNIIMNTSGSLLTGQVSVFDSSGHWVISAVAADPLEGGFVIHLNNIWPLSAYTVEVQSGQQNVFGIGSYQLTIHELPLVNSLGFLTATVTQGVNDTRTFLANTLPTNDSFASAMLLQPQASNGTAAGDSSFQGRISDSSDTDYFKFQAPASLGSDSVLTAMVWGLDVNGLDPRVRVFDAQDNPVAAEVLINDHGNYAMQIQQPVAGATYVVCVLAANLNGKQNVGNYFVGVDFSPHALVLPTLSSGTLTGSELIENTLTLSQNQLFHFVLACDTPGTTAPAAVQMTIVDSGGHILFTLVAGNNEPVSGNILLLPGTYSVLFSTSGGTPAAANYLLRGSTPSDPIGPEPTDPATSPSNQPPPPSSSYTWSGGSSSGVPPQDPSSQPYSPPPSSSPTDSSPPPSSTTTTSGSSQPPPSSDTTSGSGPATSGSGGTTGS
jgi:hypothetical protein